MSAEADVPHPWAKQLWWWTGPALFAVLAAGVLGGHTVWYVDQWRDWVLAVEPGFQSAGMDAGARLPAAGWVFEWVLRPLGLGPGPWQALPVLASMAAVLFAAGLTGGRRDVMGVSAALLLPPFVLYVQSALASGLALGLAAWAWVLADRTDGRRGWAAAALATALYPAAAPALAATGGWRLWQLRDDHPATRPWTVTLMALAVFGAAISYWLAGTAPAGYLARIRPERLPEALLHVAGGLPGIVAAGVLIVIAVRRTGRPGVAVALMAAWLVAGVGVAARSGPWSILQPAFVMSGMAAVTARRLSGSRAVSLLLLAAMGGTTLTLVTPPYRSWKQGGLVDQASDVHLPAPIHQVVYRWDAFLAVVAEARAGAEPIGEYGLPVRWALEFETRAPWHFGQIRLDTDVAGPWCRPGEICRAAPVTAAAFGAGPVLLQFLAPRRLPNPLEPMFAACAEPALRIHPAWREVRVVDLWNMLGIVGRVDLPPGCFVPAPDLYAGEWQALQIGSDGSVHRMRGSGQVPHAPRRY